MDLSPRKALKKLNTADVENPVTMSCLFAAKRPRGCVQPASQNPYPIYDQNLRYSLPFLMTWPKIRNPIYDPTLTSKTVRSAECGVRSAETTKKNLKKLENEILKIEIKEFKGELKE